MKKFTKKILSLLIVFSFISSLLTPSISASAEDKPTVINVTPTVQEAVNRTADYMIKSLPNPGYQNEWYIFSLARSSYPVPKEYYNTYYENLKKSVVENKGILHKVKYTEYSRVILALTAIGKDPTDVGGYNLVEELFNLTNVTKQGINGPIFALIALDTNKYPIPSTVTENSRQKMIDYILEKQLTDGGFALGGKAGDVDITAMALQALSSYQDQELVKLATDKAVVFLSSSQKNLGGYFSWGTENVESASQALVALTSLGIDPMTDSRFIKDAGSWIVSNIMGFYVSETGAFRHTMATASNSMATEQASYALTAYNRFVNGQVKLYDMSDVKTGTPPDPVIPGPVTPGPVTPDPVTPGPVTPDPVIPVTKIATISEISDKDTSITGSSDSGALITVKVDSKVIGTGTANSNGVFNILINKQKANKVISIYAEAAGKLQSEIITKTVIDKTPPELVIGTITDKITKVRGTAEKHSTVKLAFDGTTKQTIKVDESEGFAFTISKQKAGTIIKVIASDEAGNTSTKTVVVLDKTAPVLSVKSVSDKSTTVGGTTEAKAKVNLYLNGKLEQSTNANSKGVFTFKISKQKANLKVKVVTSDKSSNSISKTITVLDKTAPVKPSVNKLTNYSKTVIGKTEKNVTVYVYRGKTKLGTAKTNAKGTFKVKIKKQKTAAKLTIYAKDASGNKSKSASVTIKKK